MRIFWHKNEKYRLDALIRSESQINLAELDLSIKFKGWYRDLVRLIGLNDLGDGGAGIQTGGTRQSIISSPPFCINRP